MNEELDFEDYPTLHLHMMIDDYEELCRQITESGNSEKDKEEGYAGSDDYYKRIDPQGRFSFCFVN